jgi:hypothetical protein
MARKARLPRIPACPECASPGSYVWQAERQHDTYVCLAPGCPSGEYQHRCDRSLADGVDEA